MKRMIKRILLIFSILFLPILLIFVFIIYVNLGSEKDILAYISKKTPLESSRDDVRAFIGEKGYKIRWDSNHSHYLFRGATLPRIDFGGTLSPQEGTKMGASSIRVLLFDISDIVSFACVWVFDEDDKLILINVYNEWNGL
ncbi:MAG: hypothetical protein LBQ93_08910 [Treponema sp.]|jgi:hypothetical protein|nr:hypothetical protein [Treponema sp.]